MSRRNDILQLFKQHLEAYSYVGNQVARVKRGMSRLDQINDFPFISFHVVDSGTTHISDDIVYYLCEIAIRGYVYGEDSQSLADQMALDIEDAILSFDSQPNEVVDMRVVSVSTDEGLMEPYGIADLIVNLSYEQNSIV